jgi:hypothetical protein
MNTAINLQRVWGSELDYTGSRQVELVGWCEHRNAIAWKKTHVLSQDSWEGRKQPFTFCKQRKLLSIRCRESSSAFLISCAGNSYKDSPSTSAIVWLPACLSDTRALCQFKGFAIMFGLLCFCHLSATPSLATLTTLVSIPNQSGYTPFSYRVAPGSVPPHFMWNMWWTNLQFV